MKKLICFFMLILVFVSAAFAQTGDVSTGTDYDSMIATFAGFAGCVVLLTEGIKALFPKMNGLLTQLVSWCVGHLVELAPPNIYDEKHVKWSVADLPILPEKWQYLVSASTKRQFGVLKKLMHREDVESIVCATDAG